MKYIFISHADIDKQRIQPIINALLSAGIPIWVDRPDAMGLVGNDLVVEGIRSGKDWDAEIRDALQHASSILFFLSLNSCKPERSDSLYREFDHGLLNDNLVIARIDDIPRNQLAGSFRIRQGINLIGKTENPNLELDEYMQLLNRLRSYLFTKTHTKATKKNHNHRFLKNRRFRTLFPYLCNRSKQKQMFVTQLQREIDKPSKYPIFVFVLGKDDQCADKFVEQLYTIEIPNLHIVNNLADSVHRGMVRWPATISDSDGQDYLESCMGDLKFSVREILGLKQSAGKRRIQQSIDQHDGTLFLQFDIDVHQWNTCQQSLISEWMRWWSKFDFSQRRYPVTIVGRLTSTPGFMGALRTSTKTRLALKQIKEIPLGKIPAKNVLALPILNNVSFYDVNQWIGENKSVAVYDPEILLPKVRSFFSSIFGLREKRIPMIKVAMFLDTLLEEHNVSLEPEITE